MRITACPRCGSKRISAGTMGSGVTFGITSWRSMCRDCLYKGEPIVFNSEKEYYKFLTELKISPHIEKKNKKTDLSEINDDETPIDLEEKDQHIIDLLKEYETEKPPKPVWKENKKWWPEILLSLIIAGVSYVSNFFSIIPYTGMEMAIFWSIINFIASFIIILFIIVIIEYFLRSIVNCFRKTC